MRRLVPDAIKPYKARSMIEEYKGLAIVFAVMFVAFAAYFVKSVLAAPKRQPPPAQSVYVELVPQNAQRPADQPPAR